MNDIQVLELLDLYEPCDDSCCEVVGSTADRVAAGVAWLDKHAPSWVDRIDLPTLDLTNATLCVMGQVFGDYFQAPFHEGARNVGQVYATGVALGVDVPGFRNYDERDALLAEWRRVIVARRLASSRESLGVAT